MNDKLIEKLVELAPGFELGVNAEEHDEIRYLDLSHCDLFYFNVREWELYPLLLYRAKEAFENSSSLTPQEQALEDVLIEALG